MERKKVNPLEKLRSMAAFENRFSPRKVHPFYSSDWGGGGEDIHNGTK